MKYIVVFLMFLSSQVAGQVADFVVLKGVFENTTEQKLKISVYDFSYLKEVTVNQDGSFYDTLHIPVEGFYALTLGKSYTSVYVRKSDSLFVSADAGNFYESFSVKGTGAKINLVNRSRIKLQNMLLGDPKDFFVVPLDEFLAKVKNMKDSLQQLLDNSSVDERDKGIQQLLIDNYCLLIYNNYKKFYSYHMKVDPVLPDNYFAPIRQMNMDNDTAFHYSAEYRNLIIENWRYIETEVLKNDSLASMIDFTENYIKGIKSEKIKDQIVRMLFRRIAASNKNVDADYSRIMALVVNNKSKEDLIKRYKVAKSTTSGSEVVDFAFENEKGELVHLSDFKGKFVYIEVWATWCAPCIREMPSLKSLITTFKDRNIQFISISVDDKKDKNKWLKMVDEKAIGGIQLISGNKLDDSFMKYCGVSLLPRSILIGPDGKLVVAAAPRASNPETIPYLENLLKTNYSFGK